MSKSDSSFPPEMLKKNPPKPNSTYMNALLNEFPGLLVELDREEKFAPSTYFENMKQYSRYLKLSSDLSVIENHRKLLFSSSKFVIGALRPFSCPFDSWLERNPSEEEKLLIHNTVAELSDVLLTIRRAMGEIHSDGYTKEERQVYLDLLGEGMIKFDEILFDIKGFWTARYPKGVSATGNKIMTGFYYKLHNAEVPQQPFLYRLRMDLGFA